MCAEFKKAYVDPAVEGKEKEDGVEIMSKKEAM